MSLFDKVMTAKELLETEQFAGQQSWYVQDILPKCVVGLITGSEKSMKSSVAQDLAQAVSLGEKFAGKETTQANVLFIQNENSRMTEHQRLEGSKRASSEHLYFLHGGAFKLDEYAFDAKGHKYNVGLRELYQFIIEHDIGLVILDPLKDLLNDNETLNSNQPMNEVLSGITKLKNTLDTTNDMFVTFLVVAHARKQAGEQSIEDKNFRIQPSHILGATAIPAWYEVAFTMSPKVNTKTKNRYSIMNVLARNFSYSHETLWGYVGSTFTAITADSLKKEPEQDSEMVEEAKKETPKEVTKEENKTFLELAKSEGKVKEIDD